MRAARQQEIRHVHRRNREEQQHRTDHSEQYRSRATREVVPQGIDDQPPVQEGAGLPRELRERGSRNLVQLPSCLIRIDRGKQSSNHLQVMAPFPALGRQGRVILQ